MWGRGGRWLHFYSCSFVFKLGFHYPERGGGGEGVERIHTRDMLTVGIGIGIGIFIF